MASEDVDQSQSGMEDAGGPGAPTSLHALEVGALSLLYRSFTNDQRELLD